MQRVAYIDLDGVYSKLHVDVSKGEVPLLLKGLVDFDDVHGVIQGKNYQSTDMGLSCLCAFADKAT